MINKTNFPDKFEQRMTKQRSNYRERLELPEDAEKPLINKGNNVTLKINNINKISKENKKIKFYENIANNWGIDLNNNELNESLQISTLGALSNDIKVVESSEDSVSNSSDGSKQNNNECIEELIMIKKQLIKK